MLQYYNLNGKNYLNTQNNIAVNNRSFRYGDGFFETMKIVDGQLMYQDLHILRIKSSLEILQFAIPKHFSFNDLCQQVVALAKKNKMQNLARVRIVFFRGNGGLYDAVDSKPNILIETYNLENNNNWNENGLTIDTYKLAKKSDDIYSNLKSNNYLQYVMAALWAKQNKLNDAILYNTKLNITDSTIANIFVIKNKEIFTPNLSEGCVNGVMRKFIIQKLNEHGIKVFETSISEKNLLDADEIFLTNVIKGITWVKMFRNKTLSNTQTKQLWKIIFKN